MAKERVLNVYANPYTHVDHEGRPSGALPWDPTHNPERGFVGATVKAVITKRYPDEDPRQDDQDTEFVFDHDPIPIPLTPYYVKAMQSGELVLADAASAGLLGVEFKDPVAVLEAAKAACMARHEAHYGEVPESISAHAFGPCRPKAAVDKEPTKSAAPAETKAATAALVPAEAAATATAPAQKGAA